MPDTDVSVTERRGRPVFTMVLAQECTRRQYTVSYTPGTSSHRLVSVKTGEVIPDAYISLDLSLPRMDRSDTDGATAAAAASRLGYGCRM